MFCLYIINCNVVVKKFGTGFGNNKKIGFLKNVHVIGNGRALDG